MPLLLYKDFDDLPDLTPHEAMLFRASLKRSSRKMSSNDWREVTHAAIHEAAHFVANVACPGSTAWHVQIGLTQKLAGAGVVLGNEGHQDEKSFVYLAGYAIEQHLSGNIHKHAADDYEKGYLPGYEWVLDEAHAFVKDHYDLIRATACAVLLLCRPDGTLCDRNIKRLDKWIALQVRPFKSRDAGRYMCEWMLRYSPSARDDYGHHIQLLMGATGKPDSFWAGSR